MKFQIDHDLHIHSYLSTCSSDPGETPEAILRYGEQNGMPTLCLMKKSESRILPARSFTRDATWKFLIA